MTKEHLVLGAVILGVSTIAVVNFVVLREPPAQVQVVRRANTPQEQEMLNDLVALRGKDFWTGTLKYSYGGDKSPVLIYTVEDSKDGWPSSPYRTLAFPEGTRFQVVDWSDVQRTAIYIRLRFEDGREGLLSSGQEHKKVHGALLPIYDNSKGIDRGYSQMMYDVPFSEAISKQKSSQVRIDEATAAAESARKADLAREAKLNAKIAKSRGVDIGMTKAQVLASSWGRPRKVNRTTTVGGVREQWVYDGGYLYFDENVLTAIQN